MSGRRALSWLAVIAFHALIPDSYARTRSVEVPIESQRFGDLPTFSELEAAHAIIGEVHIFAQNVFDLEDPKENAVPYRLANALHILTRTATVRKMLLFHSGEPLSVRIIEETDRLLRQTAFLQDVSIRPSAWREGVVDILVLTRDTWSLEPSFNFSRQGGSNATSISLLEHNFLGTGITLGLRGSEDKNRKGTEYFISDDHALDGWTRVKLLAGNFDDGRTRQASIERPFYSLDTRWEAGASVADDQRIETVYQSGNIASQYKHESRAVELRGGLSQGLVDGWAKRYSVGLKYRDDAYRKDPALPSAGIVPADNNLVAPFARAQYVQDDFARLINRDQIDRIEYFPLGLNATVEVGRSLVALGATRDLWNYALSVDDGFSFDGNYHVLLSARTSGNYSRTGGENQHYSISARYYRPQRGHGLFFASLAADTADNGTTEDQYTLGGDNGLRGYPGSYQTGVHRVLFSMEQRAYTDWYPFRLFRVGGAMFFDHGRAWEGSNQNLSNHGWLSDIGAGLRIMSARSAVGNVLHIDFAIPLNRDTNTPSHQFLVKSHTTF